MINPEALLEAGRVSEYGLTFSEPRTSGRLYTPDQWLVFHAPHPSFTSLSSPLPLDTPNGGPRVKKMLTKNIHVYCESLPMIHARLTFGFANPHSVVGLAFVAYWGMVLFGYDTSVLLFTTLHYTERIDVGSAEVSEEAS